MAFFAVAMVLGLSGVDSFLRSMDLSRSPRPHLSPSARSRSSDGRDCGGASACRCDAGR
jgi:hypothetical protein